MSRTPPGGASRVAASWESVAGRHACRAPLWCRPGDPAHVFVGRPLAAGAAAAPEERPQELVQQALGGGRRAVSLAQEHGMKISRVGSSPGPRPLGGDGASTDDPSLALCVQSADCVPILLADRRSGAVAALHAGWRGTAAGIVPRALEHLAREYGSRAADLEAVLGPAVGGCCYEVGEEVREAFLAGPLRSLASFSRAARPRWRIDLAGVNAAWLERAGLGPERIQVLGACTRCAVDRLHSFRAEGAAVGRNWSLVSPPRRGG